MLYEVITYTERWYTKKVMRDWDSAAGKEVLTDTIHGFHRVYNYNTSLGVSTKLYGMYKPLFRITSYNVCYTKLLRKCSERNHLYSFSQYRCGYCGATYLSGH